MSTVSNIEGNKALAKVKQKLGSQAGVMSAIGALPRNPGDSMDPRSCNLTAGVVITTIFGSGEGTALPVFPLSTDRRVDKAEELLAKDHVLYIAISPDHHFVVIPTGADAVAVVQGFQGSYRVDEWLGKSGDGQMTRSNFISNLGALTSPTGGAGSVQPAAVALFGFAGVESDIRAWFSKPPIEIKMIKYYPLASGGSRNCCVIM